MYPTSTPITTMSMMNQGQGSVPAHIYGSFGSTTSSGFPQYGSATNVGGMYRPGVTPVTNTAMYPQGAGPSYQGEYRMRMQQQAVAHQPYALQSNVSSMPSGFQAGQAAAYGQNNASVRIPQQPYQGSPPPIFPRVPQTATAPNLPGQAAGVRTAPRPGQSHTMQQGITPGPSHTMQQGFTQQVLGPQRFQVADPSMFEQSILTGTNPSYAKNSASASISRQFPALQQSLNPSPPQPGGPQSGWTVGGNTARRSPQTAATAPPNASYPPQNRQVPSSTTFCPPSLQGGVAVTSPPRLCHVIKGPGYTPIYGFRFFIYPDGPYISFVQKDSAAESAGLRVGDKIIEINGFNVESEDNEQVLDQMRGLPDEMKLFVMDRATYEEYKRTGVQITSSLPRVVHLRSRPVQPGASQLYPQQGQQPRASPPMPPLLSGSVGQTIPQQIPPQRPTFLQMPPHPVVTQTTQAPVPAQTTQIPISGQTTPVTTNSTDRTEPGVSESLSQPEITEPDDKKLLGQWYLQPDTPVRAATSQKNNRTTISDNSSSNVSATAQVSLRTTVSDSSPSEAASTVTNDSGIADSANSTSRPVTPESAALQAKIFEMIKRGTPYSNFNDQNTETSSETPVNAVVSESGISYIGAYAVKENGSLRAVNTDSQGQRPPSQGSVHSIEVQATGSARPEADNDIDTKEGIKLIHTDEGIAVTDSDVVNGDRAGNDNVVGSVNDREQSIKEISPDMINSISLANQLDLDKNAAMNNLNQLTMHLNYTIDREYSVDTMLDTAIAVSASVPSANMPETASTSLPEHSVSETEQSNSGSFGQDKNEPSKSIETFPTPRSNTAEITASKEKKKSVGSNKLKVKFIQPKKASGSESPSKKIPMTWKKKMAARSMAEKEAESELGQINNEQDGIPPTENTENENDKKKKKKKRTSSEAQLNEDSEELPNSKRGRGRGGTRGRGRGQARGGGRSSPSSASGGIGRGRQPGRGRGRGRGRGLRVVAPAQNLSWQELARRQATDGLGDESPRVEVDVDEVAIPAPEETSADKLHDVAPDIDTDIVSASAASNQIQAGTDNETLSITKKTDTEENAVQTNAENMEVKTEAIDTAELKADPEDGEPEKPIVIKKAEITDNFESTELHTNANLIRKTDRYTFSWVEFHGCKILLINSEDGDYIAMKELVFEVFRPRRPEKSVQAGRYTPFKDLTKTHKIQHIYKTKEKRLHIMYKEIDPEIFELVYQILFDKKVLHKKQNRLGIISLVDALRLYHFITKVGTSECSDINVQCVVPHNSNTYHTRKREMDLIYPINFNQGSSKLLKAEECGSEADSVVDTKVPEVDTNSAPSKPQIPKNVNADKPKKTVEPPPDDVIEILDSDDESCASDVTVPYVDGAGDNSLLKEIEVKSSATVARELPVNEAPQDTEHSIINDLDTDSVMQDTNPQTEAMQTDVQNGLNTSVLAQPDLPIAPQSLNTFWLMDSMTRTESEINDLGANTNANTLTYEKGSGTTTEGSLVDKNIEMNAKSENTSKHGSSEMMCVDDIINKTVTNTDILDETLCSVSNESRIGEHSIEITNSDVLVSKEITGAKYSGKESDITDIEIQNVADANEVCLDKNTETETNKTEIPETQVTTQIETPKLDIPNLVTAETSELSRNETDIHENNELHEKENVEPKTTELVESSKSQTETNVQAAKATTEESESSTEVFGTSGTTDKFKGVKEFFDVDDDDYDFDDITLIDIGNHAMELLDEGDKRIDELIQLRKDAKTDEEIDNAWDQAIKIQRPIQTLQNAALEAYEKDKEQIAEIEKLKRENEELRKYVEEHKEYLDPMPECDRINFGSTDHTSEDSEDRR